jgi:ligand-binding sensor domain-containing protein
MSHPSLHTPGRFTQLMWICALFTVWIAGCTPIASQIDPFLSKNAETIQLKTIEYQEQPVADTLVSESYLAPESRLFAVTADGDFWTAQSATLIHWMNAGEKYELIRKPSGSGTFTAINADGNALYIGTDYGQLLRYETGAFTSIYDLGDECPIQTILAGEGDTIWLGTNQGVVRLEGDGPQAFKYPLEGMVDSFIHSLYRDSGGQLWAGTVDAVSVWRDRRWITYPLLKGEITIGMLETADHTMFAAAGPNLYRLVGDNWQAQIIPQIGSIHALVLNADKQIVLIGAVGRMVTFDPATGLSTAVWMPSAVSLGNRPDGSLVIGTTDYGLVYSGDEGWVQISTANLLPSANILSIEPVGNDEAWIATGNGLAHVTGNWPVVALVETNGSTVLSVASDNPGSLWFLTSDSIGRRVGDEYQWYPYGTDINDRPISEMVMGPDGTLWYLSRKGLVQMFNGERQIIDTPFERPDTMTHTLPSPITVDVDGLVWLAMQDGQVYSYKDGAWNSQILPVDDQITALYAVNANELWAGTTHNGLFHFQNGIWSVFDLPGKNPQPLVTRIAAAGDGLLVGTTEGLFRVQDPTSPSPVLFSTGLSEGYIQALAIDGTDAWIGYLYGGAEKVPLNKLK